MYQRSILGIWLLICVGISFIPSTIAIPFDYWKGDQIEMGNFYPRNGTTTDSLQYNMSFTLFTNDTIGHGLIHNFTISTNYNNKLTYLVDINVYTLRYWVDTSIWLSTEDIPTHISLNLSLINPSLNSEIKLLFEVRYRYMPEENITHYEVIKQANYVIYYSKSELIPALTIYPFVIGGILAFGLGMILIFYRGKKTPKEIKVTLFREGD